ncbi:hypothetical protein HDV00_007113 [Rhizophlyctis rosea]|nr:hypothetical protein HDV00_007113 [Rhizophlyctis rosea]
MPKRKIVPQSESESELSSVSSFDDNDSNAGDMLVDTPEGGEWTAAEYTTLLAGLVGFIESMLKKVKSEDEGPVLCEEVSTIRGSKLELEKWFWVLRHVRPQTETINQIDELVSFCIQNNINTKGLQGLLSIFPKNLQSRLLSRPSQLRNITKKAEKEERPSKKKKTAEGRREKDPSGYAQKLADLMRIKVTGARIGETIVGYGGIAGGTQLVVCGCDVPPVLQDVELIRQHPDIWEKFLTKIGQDISFFRSMPNNTSRATWLLTHAEPEDSLHMSDMASVSFQVLTLGTNENTAKLDEPTKEMLSSREEPIGAAKYASLFPAKLGSGTDHHTLMFGRGYWKVLDKDPCVESVGKECTVFNLSRSDLPSLTKGPIKRAKDEQLMEMNIISTDDLGSITQAACLFPTRGARLDIQSLSQKFDIIQKDLTRYQSATRHLPASALKSLLQKIIRFRPALVDLHDSLPPLRADHVLTLTFLSLLVHPGGFVPDIQRYVTGLESAAKRLAIIALEDSYPADGKVVAELVVSAFVCQRYKTWRPTLGAITRWVQFAIELWNSDRCVAYDVGKGQAAKSVKVQDAVRKGSENPFLIVSAVLDLVRSFSGDLGMARWYASIPPTKYKLLQSSTPQPTHTMPLSHCVDQHWAPNFVYLLEPIDVVYGMCKRGGSKPFAGVMGRVFEDVTGVNPRRVPGWDAGGFEGGEWVKRVRKAQRGFLGSVVGGVKEEGDGMDVDGEGGEVDTHVVETTLPDAWLAGLLGTIPVRKNKMIAALVPDDISRVIVAKKPSVRPSTSSSSSTSTAKSPPASVAESATDAAGIGEDTQTLLGEQEFWEVLSKEEGVPLNAIGVPPLKHLKGARVRIVDGDVSVFIKERGEWVAWEEARKARVELPVYGSVEDLPPIHDTDDFQPFNPPIAPFDYITAHLTRPSRTTPHILHNALPTFLQTIRTLLSTHPTAVRRFLAYISRSTPTIEIAPLSRDGGGTEGAVTADDAGAYHLCAVFAVLFPGVLRRGRGVGRFLVGSGGMVVLWDVRERVAGLLHEVEGGGESQEGTGDGEGKGKGKSKEIGNGKKKGDVWSDVELGDTGRKMLPYQEETCSELLEAHKRGRRGHFLWLPPGAGKTKIVCEFLTRLKGLGHLPPFVVYCLPKESMQTIVDELKIYGFAVRIVVGFAAAAKRYAGLEEDDTGLGGLPVDFPVDTPKATQKILINRGGTPTSETGLTHQTQIHIIEHDHLRVLAPTTLLPTTSQTLFIIDEVHLAMADTFRTAACQSLADNSREFIAMTGTPIVDSNLYRLIPWLRYLVPFEVTEKNFWCAATSMVARKVETGIPRRYEMPVVGVDDMLVEDGKMWRLLMPPKLGGGNRFAGAREFMKAAGLSYEVVTREMVRRVPELLETRKGVMIIAKDTAHAEELFTSIPLPKTQKYLLTGSTSLNLTPTTNPSNIRVVVVPFRRATGYTLTALDTVLWTVYPSNQAVRTQLEARIDRVGQDAQELLYVKVLTPLFEVIEEKHGRAKTLEEAVKGLVAEI